MNYFALISLIILYVSDQLIKKQLISKSARFQEKKMGLIKEKTGQPNTDCLFQLNNITYIIGIALIAVFIVFQVVRWLSL